MSESSVCSTEFRGQGEEGLRFVLQKGCPDCYTLLKVIRKHGMIEKYMCGNTEALWACNEALSVMRNNIAHSDHLRTDSMLRSAVHVKDVFTHALKFLDAVVSTDRYTRRAGAAQAEQQ